MNKYFEDDIVSELEQVTNDLTLVYVRHQVKSKQVRDRIDLILENLEIVIHELKES